jgi:hypothetical protein
MSTPTITNDTQLLIDVDVCNSALVVFTNQKVIAQNRLLVRLSFPY